MSTTYIPADFLKAISSGKLQSSIRIQGMVKVEEKEKNILYFSPQSNCSRWIKIPLQLIENIEHIANITCKDHQHPFVAMTLKRPGEKDTDAKIYAELLSVYTSMPTGVPANIPGFPGSNLRARRPNGLNAYTSCVWIPRIECIVTGGTPNPNGGYDGAIQECKIVWDLSCEEKQQFIMP
jgi:hypothetical protein